MKQVLLLCLNNFNNQKIINGLTKITKINKTNNKSRLPLKLKFVIFIQRETKNITRKKSFRDITLPAISKLYGDEARATPAIKAPTTIENPR